MPHLEPGRPLLSRIRADLPPDAVFPLFSLMPPAQVASMLDRVARLHAVDSVTASRYLHAATGCVLVVAAHPGLQIAVPAGVHDALTVLLTEDHGPNDPVAALLVRLGGGADILLRSDPRTDDVVTAVTPETAHGMLTILGLAARTPCNDVCAWTGPGTGIVSTQTTPMTPARVRRVRADSRRLPLPLRTVPIANPLAWTR